MSQPRAFRPAFTLDDAQVIMSSGEALAWRRILAAPGDTDGVLAVLHHTYGDAFSCSNRMMSEAIILEDGAIASCAPKILERTRRRALGLSDAERLLKRVSKTQCILGALYGGANILRATRVHDMRHVILPGVMVTLPMQSPDRLHAALDPSADAPVGRIMVSPSMSAHSKVHQLGIVQDALARLAPIWAHLSEGAPFPVLEA